jgi:N-acetylglucosamine-6-phosphate deacetylase
MSEPCVTLRGGRIFDGAQLHDGCALRFEQGALTAFGPERDVAEQGKVIDLGGDILSPGFVDLQVNGGDGVLLNDGAFPHTLRRIAKAHRRLGATHILPTLITDTPETTRKAIASAIAVINEGDTGIAGLHLEGPHLSIARKGAHDGSLIRRMEDDDLDLLLYAAEQLPCLKVTIAPENVTEAQVMALAQAGVLVSLGHTDADYETCQRYFAAGARCVTHLFNAMSQLGSRAPGLVGAALVNETVAAGIIADGIHVHPATLRMAWDAKRGDDALFLVSDAMAVAGSDAIEFELNGRAIYRQEGRLTLADGTLAGADLDLLTAVRIMVQQVHVPLENALRAATLAPANLIGMSASNPTQIGCKLSDVIRIPHDLSHPNDGFCAVI